MTNCQTRRVRQRIQSLTSSLNTVSIREQRRLREERASLLGQLQDDRADKRRTLLSHADLLALHADQASFPHDFRFALRVAVELFHDTRDAAIQRAIRRASADAS